MSHWKVYEWVESLRKGRPDVIRDISSALKGMVIVCYLLSVQEKDSTGMGMSVCLSV
jgi:hypothetical protein